MTNAIDRILLKLKRPQYLITNEDVLTINRIKKWPDSKTDEKKLTDITYWESKNISPWYERWLFSFPLTIGILLLSTVGAITLLLLSEMWLHVLLKPIYFYLFIFIIVAVLSFLFKKANIYLIAVELLFIPILEFYYILNLPLFTLLVTIYIISITDILLIYYYIYETNKKDPHINELLKDVFNYALCVKKILTYKRAVCKDYAKLTAALLYSIFTNKHIYYYSFLSHVAVGIKFKDKVYILDNGSFPILTEDMWLDKWNKKKAYKELLLKENNKFVIKKVEEIKKKTRGDLFEKYSRILNKIVNTTKRKKIMKTRLPRWIYEDKVIFESFKKQIELYIEKETLRKPKIKIEKIKDKIMLFVSVIQ